MENTENWRRNQPLTGKLVVLGEQHLGGRGGGGWISVAVTTPWGPGEEVWAQPVHVHPSQLADAACSAEVWDPTPARRLFSTGPRSTPTRPPAALSWMAPTPHCQKSVTWSQETAGEAGPGDGAELARSLGLQARHLDLWLWARRSFQFPCSTAPDHGLNNQELTQRHKPGLHSPRMNLQHWSPKPATCSNTDNRGSRAGPLGTSGVAAQEGEGMGGDNRLYSGTLL